MSGGEQKMSGGPGLEIKNQAGFFEMEFEKSAPGIESVGNSMRLAGDLLARCDGGLRDFAKLYRARAEDLLPARFVSAAVRPGDQFMGTSSGAPAPSRV